MKIKNIIKSRVLNIQSSNSNRCPYKHCVLGKKNNFIENCESGLVLVWFSVGVFALLAIAALVIDIGRLRTIQRSLQNAVDAAAIAGAAKIDGRVDGWRSAKRSALSVLRNNTIQHVSSRLHDDGVQLTRGGKDDVLETTPELRDIRGRVGDTEVTIERGVYWVNPIDNQTFEFTSIEGRPASNFRNSDGIAVPLYRSLPTYMIVNAVKVKVEVANVNTLLGRILSFGKFNNINAESTATADDILESCTLPAAVPACALLANLNYENDASNNKRYQLDEYVASEQCSREFMVTEANPLGLANYSKRAEGILRAELYPRKPTYYDENIENQRVIPLYGTLGIGATGPMSPDTPATAAEVLSVFERSRSCNTIRLGARFKPLEDALGPGEVGGLYTDPNITSRLKSRLRDLINNGERFSNVFAEDTKYFNKPRSKYDPNTGELRYVWPGPIGDMVINLNQPPIPSKDESWVNPLCHDWGDDLDNPPVPRNINNARAVRTRLMVIAPTTNDDFSNVGSYCDFRSLFQEAEQNTTAPTATTNPRVVGFVAADLFDFQVDNYQKRDDWRNRLPRTLVHEFDNNPDKLDASLVYDRDQTKNFVQETKEWTKCRATRRCAPGEIPAPNVCTTDEDCLKLKPKLAKPNRPQAGVTNACLTIPNWDRLENCTESMTIEECRESGQSCDDTATGINQECDEFLNEIEESSEEASEDLVCLPMKDPACWPSSDFRCWEPPAPRQSQYGCGGLRMRLKCEQQVIPFLTSRAGFSPALVE
jgi:hypothetical protein